MEEEVKKTLLYVCDGIMGIRFALGHLSLSLGVGTQILIALLNPVLTLAFAYLPSITHTS